MKRYTFNYMTEVYKKAEHRRYNEMVSDTDLEMGEAIIIVKDNTGIFIGIVEDCLGEYEGDLPYRFYAKCAEGNRFLEEKRKAERKAELVAAMEEKFKEIDKERKFEYYATLDESFKGLLEEYKSLA